jgi:hypothetical protein
VAQGTIDDLLKPEVEKPPTPLSKDPEVETQSEEPTAEINKDVSEIYNKMKNENINTIQEAAVGKFDDIHVNLEALDDTQFTALIERIKGCRT